MNKQKEDLWGETKSWLNRRSVHQGWFMDILYVSQENQVTHLLVAPYRTAQAPCSASKNN